MAKLSKGDISAEVHPGTSERVEQAGRSSGKKPTTVKSNRKSVALRSKQTSRKNHLTTNGDGVDRQCILP
jgi:hypothetical protein